MNETPVYRHVQTGKAMRVVLVVVGILLLAPLAPLLVGSRAMILFAMSFGLIFGAACCFLAAAFTTTLTIEVTPSVVRWWFGTGWPRSEIARADIRSVGICRPSIVFGGVGLHLTLQGWLWNVQLGQAVEIERAGGMPVLLGTDDPEGLANALT